VELWWHKGTDVNEHVMVAQTLRDRKNESQPAASPLKHGRRVKQNRCPQGSLGVVAV